MQRKLTIFVLLILRGLIVPTALSAQPSAVWLDVPFIKQEKDACGAASIAMVMQYWLRQQGLAADSSADATHIQHVLYSSKAHGIYASEMEHYFQQSGFRTFTIRGEWEDLNEHLQKGRPLIVALKPGAGGDLHYVVVTGLDSSQDSVLLDRAIAFAPASTLRLPELLLTHSRVHGLGIFPIYSVDLLAREDGAFDVVFRNWERNGWGHNYKEGLFLLLRGLPFQTINPELYNLKHEAINFVSLFRWDAEKRRVTAQLSSPFKHNPKFNYQLFTDLRSENWNIQSSFQGPTTLLGSLNLRREAIGANFTSFPGARWRWSAGAEISHRDFRSVISGTALTPILLAKGYQLKQAAHVEVSLWRAPERRMNLDAGARSEAGRIWWQPSHSFDKLQGSARFHWFPQAENDDYEMQYQVRAGKTFGDVPFDELFMLGLERDKDL